MSSVRLKGLKIDQLLDNWAQEYRKKQEKAQVTTIETRSERSSQSHDKYKFPRIKFFTKDGHVGFKMIFNLYPESLVFGDSAKLLDSVEIKKNKHRDNDQLSDDEDIAHAVAKGIKKLKQEIQVRAIEKIIKATEEKGRKKKRIYKRR